jgi:hypothetical protein
VKDGIEKKIRKRERKDGRKRARRKEKFNLFLHTALELFLRSSI